MSKTYEDLMKLCRDRQIETVDLKYIDLFGRWYHLSFPATRLSEELFVKGEPFDGSSVPGYKAVEGGDMVMIPDLNTMEMDPFWARPTLSMICDICEADTREHFSRDPARGGQARRGLPAPNGLRRPQPLGPGIRVLHLRFGQREGRHQHQLLHDRLRRGGLEQPDGRQKPGAARSPITAVTTPRRRWTPCTTCAPRCAHVLSEMGVPVRYHHHEVGGPGQSEIETLLGTLTEMGDHTMRAKYVIKNIAKKYGKTVTFMPKPLFNEAGSGLHFHQLLLGADGTNLFYNEKGYAGLSDLALYYIGGLLHHGRALLALTSPSTNSFKRLVPGFEAPTKLFFGMANRSAAVRVPKYATSAADKRIEFRPPDGTCNVYFAMAAQLMAGIDGIRNKIDPRERGMGPYDVNVRDIPKAQLAEIKDCPASLKEALEALEADHEFLLEGGVFTRDIIKTWTAYKYEKEYMAVRNRPHPHEIRLYFDF